MDMLTMGVQYDIIWMFAPNCRTMIWPTSHYIIVIRQMFWPSTRNWCFLGYQSHERGNLLVQYVGEKLNAKKSLRKVAIYSVQWTRRKSTKICLYYCVNIH